MPTKRIPPLVIQQWGKVKHELVATIQKINDPTVTSKDKKEMSKQIETLFTTFDSGLRDRLKKASTAKSDAEAKKALQEVVTVSTDYLAKLKVARAKWGVGARSVGDVIEKNLVRIKEVATTTLKAMG